MTTIRCIFILLLIAAICCSLGCSSSNSPNPSQQSQASVSIALNPAPATQTIVAGTTAGIQFTPVVSNDPSKYGVDWALTCPLTLAGACGTLSITTFHSASGTAVTYFPPTLLFTGSLTVNITVFATADHTKNVTTPITVTSYTAVLKGTYVLQVQGEDYSSGAPYQSAGVFVFDGNGNVTSGQQTLNTFSGFSSTYTVQAVQGSTGVPSAYFIGPDGRGNLTLNLQSTNPTTSTAITETFSFTVISSSLALIADLDQGNGFSGSGTLELQDAAAAATMPTGAYAFVTNGSDSGSPTGPLGGLPAPTVIGGVFNIDNNPSSGAISGNGSLADQDYYNSTNTNRKLLRCTAPTGSVSAPSSPGIVTIILTGTTCFGQTFPATVQFTGYIVDATHIRLIESDDLDGTSGFLTAGIAVGQGSAAGTFTNASLSGTYVFGVLGYDIFFGVPESFTSVAVLTADGIGNLTDGMTDTFIPSSGLAYTASPLKGTYSVDTGLIGRVDLVPKFKSLNGNPGLNPNIVAYLTGNGTPPLVLWSNGANPYYPTVGTGIAYPQAASASTLSLGNPETYGLTYTENNFSEFDGNGEVQSTVNGVTGTLIGNVEDFNNNDFIQSPPTPITDAFGLPADSFGRIGGTLNNTSGSSNVFEYYLIDNNHGFMIETDLTNTGQVGLGYFAQSCDVTNPTSCQSAAQKVAPSLLRKTSARSLRNSNISVR